MPFAFTARTHTIAQVRRIAREQIDKSLKEAEKAEEGFDATVHRIRRRSKRLRGLLRLVKPAFDDFSRENTTIRDAAQKLSGSRDAKVVQETFEDLVKDTGLSLNSEGLGAVRTALGADEAGPDEEQGKSILADFAKHLTPVQERIERWEFDGHGFGILDDGLEANYRRLRNGMAMAKKTHSAEDLHEWRKAAKYHWHHVTLFERGAPELLGPLKEALDALGERLGDHHNLHVLDERLRDAGEFPPGVADHVHEAITKRQHDLAAEAFTLGGQLTAERPSALRDRFAAYWQLLPED